MEKFIEIFQLLYNNYYNKINSFYYSDPYKILIFTVLSAQTNDNITIKVCDVLFKKYPNINLLSKSKIEDLEKIIYSCGFYHKKSYYLIEISKIIVNNFNSNIPNTMRDLLTLPGVGRKTANIVLSNAFFKNEGIAVDTHVKRLSNRLCLSISNNSKIIEKDLMNIFDKKQWSYINKIFIFHGRSICHSKNPNCYICILNKYCYYYKINK